MIPRRITHELERTIYAIAGLPIAVYGASIAATPAAREIRRAFAHSYWHPETVSDGIELIVGLMLVPIIVPLAAMWFTARNGRVIRQREGKGLVRQFLEQLRLYASAGVVGPWYYILSLYRDGMRRAPTFLQRCETKRGIYRLLKSENASQLGNKWLFAQRCVAAGVRCVPCELLIDGGQLGPIHLPDCDLFVKPVTSSGGGGAERWDMAGPRRWSNGKMELGERALVDQLCSRRRPLIIQKRVRPHPALLELTSGAVPTVRALTCLDEHGRPELLAAVFRMSIGANRTVDNIHAGGLACSVSLDDGVLGLASNLGADARLGWCPDHPTTGGHIEGTALPHWQEVRLLAVEAHSAFADRILIGWDIAIAEDGPIIIEGNRGPDMDLMQRFMDVGFCQDHRFGELIAHHLRTRDYGSETVSAQDATRPRAEPDAGGISAR
jgi:hypothetical protein